MWAQVKGRSEDALLALFPSGYMFRMRYVAGEDAKATYAMRLQIGDEAFRKAVDQQFFGR